MPKNLQKKFRSCVLAFVLTVTLGQFNRSDHFHFKFRFCERHGKDGKVADLLDTVAADCPKRKAANFSDRCDAKCPDLPKVL
jgi:hypothetical protein